MLEKDVNALLSGDSLSGNISVQYLKLYVADIDWRPHLRTLAAKASVEDARQAIACAVLLRTLEPSVRIDPDAPESLLLRVPYFHQFRQRNWLEGLKAVVRQDFTIQGWRAEAYGLGIVRPIEYQPYTRQAFNWLCERSQAGGWMTSSNEHETADHFRKLVEAYGGAVICNIFTRHPEALKKVLHWRNGYFLERQIFKLEGRPGVGVYTREQVLKIKRDELKATNEKLVKHANLI